MDRETPFCVLVQEGAFFLGGGGGCKKTRELVRRFEGEEWKSGGLLRGVGWGFWSRARALMNLLGTVQKKGCAK